MVHYFFVVCFYSVYVAYVILHFSIFCFEILLLVLFEVSVNEFRFCTEFLLFSVFFYVVDLPHYYIPGYFYVIAYMLFQYPVIAVVFCIFNFVLCYYMIIFSTPSPWFNVFDILFLCCKIIAYIPLFLCFHVYITYSAVLYCLMVLVIQPAS